MARAGHHSLASRSAGLRSAFARRWDELVAANDAPARVMSREAKTAGARPRSVAMFQVSAAVPDHPSASPGRRDRGVPQGEHQDSSAQLHAPPPRAREVRLALPCPYHIVGESGSECATASSRCDTPTAVSAHTEMDRERVQNRGQPRADATMRRAVEQPRRPTRWAILVPRRRHR